MVPVRRTEGAERPMSTNRAPNILLFMADQLTPFALPFYAQRAALAPNLSAMAEKGTTFENF